ncbi:hypothetical protein [Pontiella desulfatans]|uniref:hypothetical protein n=1 Tax=Pontiella desulfatans TaxID=2750659 RepID=UPI0014449719|nr:hypothetical protein [Pontiella desulfatans]
MEEALTSEPFTVWGLISSAGIFGAIVILISSLLIIVSTIGLISNRSKSKFYQWILGVIVKFNLLSATIIFTAGIIKFIVISQTAMCFHYHSYLKELLMGIHILLLTALVAFGIKTLSSIKQKFCQPEH